MIPNNIDTNFTKLVTNIAFQHKCKIQKINNIELDQIDSIYFFGNFCLNSPIHVNNYILQTYYNKFNSSKPIYMYCTKLNKWCLINSDMEWIRISRPPGISGNFLILRDESVDINSIVQEIKLLFL